MVAKKIFSVLLLLTGVLSIILSFYTFNASMGGYESNITYGGDAYTGIQNAAAQTANNIRNLTGVLADGLGSILLIGGLSLIFSSLIMLFGGANRPPKKETVINYPSTAKSTTIKYDETKMWRCEKCGGRTPNSQMTCKCCGAVKPSQKPIVQKTEPKEKATRCVCGELFYGKICPNCGRTKSDNLN